MSTSSASSVTSTPLRFPLARLTVVPASKPKKPRCYVKLAISHRLYWKVVGNDKEPAPTSLHDFKNQSSLTLERLPSNATWEDVTNQVAPLEQDDLSLLVPGRLHGRARNKMLTVSDECSVVLTASTTAERDRWMNEIRLRISPPQVLQERAKTLVNDDGSGAASFADLTYEMKSLFIGDIAGQHLDELKEVPSESVNEITSASSRRTRIATRVNAAVPKVEWMEKINAQFASWIGFVASAVEKGAGASEMVANTAKDVADYAKFIPGVSAVFQLVALSARLVVMYAEANRGCRELPDLLGKVMDLLDCVAGSVAPILNPTTSLIEAEKILEGNIFEVLVTTFDLSGKIEDQLMRGNWGRFLNFSVVEEIDRELATLKQMVVSVALTKQMKGIEVLVKEGFDEVRMRFDGIDLNPQVFLSTGLLPRPKPSPFFVGRRDALVLLKNVLEERGSVAITGLGGVGKTHLMAKFAEQIELNGDVPGGVFWLTADGKAEDIIESLATFAEKIHGQEMKSKDRTNREVVVETIRQGLNEIKGRWLLCVDNVDYAGQSDVNVILGALTSMAQDGGWVMVTSRAGSAMLWMRMKQGQNVVLQPLSTEDGMRVILRLKETIDTDEANDEVIGEKLRQLELRNKIEFKALRELAESLSGLALALAQAAAFIRSQDCTFSEYVQLYRTASKKSQFDFVLRRTEDELSPVREEQRSVFATWIISVERLSEEAVSMLHAVAMLGNAPMPAGLLKEVLIEVGEENEAPELRYRKVVHCELVCGSSLLQRIRGESGDSFDIHRLVRLFVLVSMEEDSLQGWDMELTRVIKATHSYLGGVLLQAGKGFYDDPEGHEDRQIYLLPHTRSVMRHREKRGIMTLEHESTELCHFTALCLRWIGRSREAEAVYDALLKMQYEIHGREAWNKDISISAHRLGGVYKDQGKLEQAEKMYELCLEQTLALLGSNRPHLLLAKAYHQLGNVYQLQRKLERAEKMHNLSLEMKIAMYGSDRPDTNVSASYYQLGSIYLDQGRHDEAEEMIRKSLEMELAIHGSDTPHPSVAGSWNSLGLVLARKGHLNEAMDMYMRALDMYRDIFGPDSEHPTIAMVMRNIRQIENEEETSRASTQSDDAALLHQVGMIYHNEGNLVQAEKMYDDSLKMKLAIHGSNRPHSDIAASYHQLGMVYNDQGKLQLAEKMHRLSLDVRVAIYGSNGTHPDIARSYFNLGGVYKDQGNLQQAEKMFRLCLDMEFAIHGREKLHRNIAAAFQQVAHVYQLQGRLVQAENFAGQSLRYMLTIHDFESHPDVAMSYHQLGSVYYDQRRLVEAEKKIRKSLEMKHTLHGSETPLPCFAETLHLLGVVLMEQGHREEATDMFMRALNMYRDVYGSDSEHPTIVMVMNNIQRIPNTQQRIHGTLGNGQEQLWWRNKKDY